MNNRKPTEKTVADNSPCLQWCAACRARAAGLGEPPYGPSDLGKLALPQEPDPVSSDPQVRAAAAARDEARAVFDEFDRTYMDALRANNHASLSGEVDAATRRRLSRAVADAAAHREAAWQTVVAANTAHRTVTVAAAAALRDAS